MGIVLSTCRKIALLILLIAGTPFGAGQIPKCHAGIDQEPPAAPRPPGGGEKQAEPRTGEKLFIGQKRFEKGGPPCGTCHGMAGISFPGGGTLGPDLTEAFRKYGDEGLKPILATLFFPTMNPVFENKLLTEPEGRDLQAFFKEASDIPPSRSDAPYFPLMALAGLVLLLALAWWFRRKHPPPVHTSLLAGNRIGGLP